MACLSLVWRVKPAWLRCWATLACLEHAGACQLNAKAGLSFLLTCLALRRPRAVWLQPACQLRRTSEQSCWCLMECLLAPCSLFTMLIMLLVPCRLDLS